MREINIIHQWKKGKFNWDGWIVKKYTKIHIIIWLLTSFIEMGSYSNSMFVHKFRTSFKFKAQYILHNYIVFLWWFEKLYFVWVLILWIIVLILKLTYFYVCNLNLNCLFLFFFKKKFAFILNMILSQLCFKNHKSLFLLTI